MLQLELGKTIRSTAPALRLGAGAWWSFAGCIALIVAAAWLRSWLFAPVPAQQISLGDGRSINLLRSGTCPFGFRLLYSVQDGKTTEPIALPHSCACTGINYESLRSADGNVVAVVDYASPRHVLVLHDFATHESWPAPVASAGSGQIGKRLLEQIKSSNPDEELILQPNQ